jgi:hypothetical protein
MERCGGTKGEEQAGLFLILLISTSARVGLSYLVYPIHPVQEEMIPVFQISCFRGYGLEL